MLKNEQGQTRGKGGSKLGYLEQMYFLNVPLQFKFETDVQKPGKTHLKPLLEPNVKGLRLQIEIISTIFDLISKQQANLPLLLSD